jgi:hypothetical protein
MGTAPVSHNWPWAGRPGGRGWRRLARRTHNPLLRRPTSGERLVKGVAMALFTLMVLATAVGCVLVYLSGAAGERAEADHRPISVTVVKQLQPTASGSYYLADTFLEVTYQVDGETRVATLTTRFGAAPGARIDAWVDREGRLTDRPQTRSVTLARTVVAAVGGLILLISVAMAGRTAVNAWSMRLRAQEWEADWLLFDTRRTR